MSVRPGTPPDDSLTALAADLPRFATAQPEGPALLDRAMNRLNEPEAQGLVPHEIYVLELRDVLERFGLNRARPAGWRYLLRGAPTAPLAILAADVQVAAGGRYRMHALDQGAFPRRTMMAFARLQQDPRVPQHDFVLRLLLFPAGRLRSIWLRAADRPGFDDDLFYPLNDPLKPAGEPPDILVTHDQMEEMLYAVARAVDTNDAEAR
jgi:hypothetical protein